MLIIFRYFSLQAVNVNFIDLKGTLLWSRLFFSCISLIVSSLTVRLKIRQVCALYRENRMSRSYTSGAVNHLLNKVYDISLWKSSLSVYFLFVCQILLFSLTSLSQYNLSGCFSASHSLSLSLPLSLFVSPTHSLTGWFRISVITYYTITIPDRRRAPIRYQRQSLKAAEECFVKITNRQNLIL